MANIEKGRNKFYIGDDETNPIAEITFKPKGEGVIIVDHTYVSDELRGQGIAGQLVEKIASYAEEENLKIDPVCPYVKNKMEKTPAYQSLIAE